MAQLQTTQRLALVAAGLVAAMLIGVVLWVLCFAQTTVLLVRHADRVPGEDALSAAGLARAQALVHVATKAGVSAIYHSEALRTQQTAQPLATALGLTPTQLPATNTQALADDIYTQHYGQTVLVVGHSNTVPQIIAALGGPALPSIDDNEFDNLFVVTICHCKRRPVKVINLQYSAVSP